MSLKVADRFCIPLSWFCHQHQHDIGWPRFEREILRGSAITMSEEYWRAWPARHQWEAEQK